MKSTINNLYIFDFDGVIANSRKVGYQTHNYIKDKYNLPQINSQKDYLKIIDNHHLKNFLSDTEITNYYLESNAYYKSHLNEIEIFPSIKKVLTNAENNAIIISSSPDSFIKKILINNGIEKVIIYGKEKAKSKKERFNLLLKEHNIQNYDIIYIGDTIDDYHFCRQVNVPMIGSNFGYSDLSEIKDSLLEIKESEKELANLIESHVMIRR